jgi:hypothetical protein
MFKPVSAEAAGDATLAHIEYLNRRELLDILKRIPVAVEATKTSTERLRAKLRRTYRRVPELVRRALEAVT